MTCEQKGQPNREYTARLPRRYPMKTVILIVVLILALSACKTTNHGYTFDQIVAEELAKLSSKDRERIRAMSFSEFISNLGVQQWQLNVMNKYGMKNPEVLQALGYRASVLFSEQAAEDVVVTVFEKVQENGNPSYLR